MKVLVTAGSKYGATAEIAEAIGEVLRERGHEVTVAQVEEVDDVEAFDAAVIGSAVYTGRWLKPAKEFVERHGEALAKRPVWLFSSGPIGDPPKPEEDPVDASPLVGATGAREHRVFAGKLEKSGLSFGEKAIVLAFRAPEGDYRDWDEIRGWASGIADALEAGAG
jgi:menaquinone-dependent protoporphyrinogen oxidase